MKTFIRATGNISPQKTFGYRPGKSPLLAEPVIHNGNRLRCSEPDYLQFIDVKFIRRMSRIIKMGTAAAMDCLQQAAVENPDAIVMGTAYGCLEDTGIFMKKMAEQQEEMLTPTAFIQSTHNTIGAQIALLLQCHNYNNTFVHRGFSFESALLDAIMLLEENTATTVLAGAADEITDFSHAILSRFGLYKKEEMATAQLYTSSSKGTVAHYKHLCGEYPTSTSFALWLAAACIKEGAMPALVSASPPEKLQRILIFNHYQHIHYSLMLVSAC